MNLLPRAIRQHPIASIMGLCFLLIAVFIARNLLSVGEDHRLASIRAAGYPVTLADLNSFYPAVPFDQNAALVYQQVFATDLLTNRIIDDVLKDAETSRGAPLSAEARATLAAFLASNAAARQLLYSGTNFSDSRFPLDMRQGHMVLLPHLAKVKTATQLLTLEGLAHASAAESNETYAAFNAALRVGASLKEEPILISHLVQIACSALAAKRLEQALNLVAMQEDQLRNLQKEFALAGDSRYSARALAGERAFGLSFFINQQIQASMTNPQQSFGSFPSGIGGQLVMAAYRASGLMAKDKECYLDAMEKCVALAELPAHERVKTGPPPNLSPTNRFLILSRMLLPALQRAIDRDDENAARMGVVEAGLGVERYRVAHAGALPDNLNQLAPQYLAAVPLDPYDSQPLRYKKLPRGYVVYSIGADQKDDGGAEPPPRPKSGNRPKSTPSDITFTVERK